MQHATRKPPIYDVLVWDGSNTSEFTSNLNGVTTATSGTNLLLIQGSNVIMIPQGNYAVTSGPDTNLAYIENLTPDEFNATYVLSS